MKNEDRQGYFYGKSNMDNLTFSESWKQKSVELAATGAIVAGAATLAVKGDVADSLKYGKQSAKQALKGFERYVARRSNPATKLIYNTGKKTFRNVSRTKPIDGKAELDASINKSRKSFDNIKESDVISEASRRQRSLEEQHSHLKSVAKELGEKAPTFEKVDPIRIQEEVRQDMYEMNQRKHSTQPSRKTGNKDAESGQKGNRAATFVGGALSGLGFGAGLTAVHALNSGANDVENQNFEAAGSFIRKGKDGKNMRKEAGVRQVHDGLASLGKKVPHAAATGLGFTGVSLGTASLLNKSREKNKVDEQGKNRIIIEFGEDDLEDKDTGSHASMGRLGLLPRPELDKSASVSNFLKNLGGRSTELTSLSNRTENFDYQSAAAKQLKMHDVDSLAKKRYGHLFDGEKAGEKLLEEETKRLRNIDLNTIESIKDDVANARVKSGVGIGLAGLGVSGLSALTKNNEKG